MTDALHPLRTDAAASGFVAAAEIAVPPTGVKPAVVSVAEFATELEPSATEFAVVAVAAADRHRSCHC